MERHNANAQALAEFLVGHPRVAAVHYAGLSTHPQHDIAQKQMRGFGGVVSFEVKGDLDAASRTVDACRIPYIAASLGGAESLIEQPAIMSFYELTTEERSRRHQVIHSYAGAQTPTLIASSPGARRAFAGA